MHGHRRPARRAHPLRVVDLAREHAPPLAAEEASAWYAGLRSAYLLHEHFPAFAREHAAQLPVSLPGLLGCMSAFRQLVELTGLPLREVRDPYGYDAEGLPHGDTPAETLTMFDGVSEEWMGEIAYWVLTPRPRYYGLGVHGVLDEGEEAPDTLTWLLWHLYSRTRQAIGIALPFEQLTRFLDEDVVLRIDKIKPLPSDTPLGLLAYHLDIPEARHLAASLAPDCPDGVAIATRALINYAFARTGNELADHSDYEVEVIHMGETDEAWDWSDLPRMIHLAHEAAALEAAYDSWSRRVSHNPDREIPKLAGAIHKAARAAEQELATGGTPLIDLLYRNGEVVE